jgi:hypothetical protein
VRGEVCSSRYAGIEQVGIKFSWYRSDSKTALRAVCFMVTKHLCRLASEKHGYKLVDNRSVSRLKSVFTPHPSLLTPHI